MELAQPKVVPLRDYKLPYEGDAVWFFRKHRAELVKEGAALLLGGTWHVLPAVMDECVVKIGLRQARTGLPRGPRDPIHVARAQAAAAEALRRRREGGTA